MSEEFVKSINAAAGKACRKAGDLAARGRHSSLEKSFALAYRKARHKLNNGNGHAISRLYWQDKEDYLQDAALKIWIRVSEGSISLEGEDHLVNLLRRASRNAAIDAWRKETRKGRINHDVLSSVEPGSPFLRQDFELDLEPSEVLDHLSCEERRLLFARAVFGMSWQEISRLMGTTEQAVRTRFCRLKSRLADKLGTAQADCGKPHGTPGDKRIGLRKESGGELGKGLLVLPRRNSRVTGGVIRAGTQRGRNSFQLSDVN